MKLILKINFQIFDLAYLIFIIHAYVDNSWLQYYFQHKYELFWTLISIGYEVFGLFVTYRYSQRGLRLVTID